MITIMKESITSEDRVPRTVGQEKQLKRLLEDGWPKAYALLLKKFNPDKDGMDRLLGKGDEIVNAMTDAILEKAREFTVVDRYADEEVESSYRYPDEYKGPWPIKEQIMKLAKMIFRLDPKPALEFADKILPTFTLPADAEGWFATLSPSALEKLFPQVTDLGERYCTAVLIVLERIAASRQFYNYRKGQITEHHLRQHAHTVSAIAKIAEVQKGDILIIPAQLGLRHRGRSVRRAHVCFANGEFGLRSLDMGCIALTHPERFVRFEELDTDCLGDEFAPEADGVFSLSPFFRWSGGGLRFGADVVDVADGGFGSASGFPPQYPCTSKS